MNHLILSVNGIHHKQHLLIAKLIPLLLFLFCVNSFEVTAQSITDTANLPPPSNIWGSYYGNYRVFLTWEPPEEQMNYQNRELGDLIAYHLYKNEDMIGSTPANILEFVTEKYAGGGYYYFYVTAVYGQPTPRESLKTGPASVWIPGTGTISCNIMDTGGPILGVTVTIGPYSIVTGPGSPAYFELQAGVYNILFEKTGYYSHTINQMAVVEEQTIELNVIMSEKLLPPQDFTIKPLTPFAQWLPPELDREIVFNENFDLYYQLGRWQQDKTTNNLEWSMSTGSPSGIPDTSHSGSNNISLFGNPGTARLVSPQILLTDSG